MLNNNYSEECEDTSPRIPDSYHHGILIQARHVTRIKFHNCQIPRINQGACSYNT